VALAAGLSPVHHCKRGALRPERWTAVAHAVYAKAKEAAVPAPATRSGRVRSRSLVPGEPAARGGSAGVAELCIVERVGWDAPV